MVPYKLHNVEEDPAIKASRVEILPPKDIRLDLPYQCHVELGVITDLGRERLWVKVTEKEAGEDIYYGSLSEHPKICKEFGINDDIQFSSENIFYIM